MWRIHPLHNTSWSPKSYSFVGFCPTQFKTSVNRGGVFSSGHSLHRQIQHQQWNDIWNGSYMNCGYEIKWSYDPRSYERNFCNCVKKPEKFRTSTGFEPVTSRYRCDARIIASLDFISTVHIWSISYIISSLIHSSREHWNPQMTNWAMKPLTLGAG